jgi:carbohydrate kinase (thermoresistant glucokinase family)
MVIVLMGPMGCGKTTIGRLLGQKTGWEFADADDYHPQANKVKMGQGIPLDDHDRKPWLETLGRLIQDHVAEEKDLILACSALKKSYRTLLGIDEKTVYSVFLKGSFALLQERIQSRSHEYMPSALLQSQLDTLEPPENGLVVDIAALPDEICQKIIETLIS